MRTRIDVDLREIARIVKIINEYSNEEISIKDFLVELLRHKVSSSDYLFIILSKLQEMGFVEGKYGTLKIKKNITDVLTKKLTNDLTKEISQKKIILVTPLELAKFYQCPRRFYLEKVVLSRQFKKEKGEVWDGEVLHLSVKLFIDNLMKKSVDELVNKVPKFALERFKDKATIKKEALSNFLLKLYQLIEDERFDFLISERTLLSIKRGLIGTPDIIGRRANGEYIPIDIKLGRIDRRGIKKEHLLQNVGEAILVEDFLRTKIDKSYLIYFQADSEIRVHLTDEMKKEFISYKKELERVSTRTIIPNTSRLQNSRTRVCKGCHVKHACDNIEELVMTMGR